MEVNDELGALEQGLRVLTTRLDRGGRIVFKEVKEMFPEDVQALARFAVR